MAEAAADLDVAVIGAGAAGLAAAKRLAGAASCLVLEAADRIGGRAWTRHVGGFALDAGCGWLHSADRNPFVAIAEGLGLTVDRTPPRWRRQSRGLGFAPGEQAAFRDAFDAFEARIERATEQPDRPAADFLEPGGRWNSLIDALSGYISGVELARVSAHDLARYADSEVNWRVVEGYGTAVAAHAAGVRVKLGCAVRRIDHGANPLAVETAEGTLRARAVIVAVPTPALADGELAFEPALPAKQDAAAALPLGVADKLVLALDAPDEFELEGNFFGRTDGPTASYRLRPFGRPLIEGYFGGALAETLERGGKESFAAFAIDELVRLLGGGIRTRLRPLTVSAWRRDPLIRGSYSCALPGQAGARAILAEPVDGRLFFAGEACSPDWFSTAHGAHLTGIAAAERALAALARV